jgi:hypothetical protein
MCIVPPHELIIKLTGYPFQVKNVIVKSTQPSGWFSNPPPKRQGENMLHSYIFAVIMNTSVISTVIILIYPADKYHCRLMRLDISRGQINGISMDAGMTHFAAMDKSRMRKRFPPA